MSIEVKTGPEADLDRWNDYVERATAGDLFHRQETLEIQARHKDCRVHQLVGYKGQEPVGIFPIFEISKGPVTTAFSPPPDIRIPYQGPALLNMGKLKQRKAERRHQQFIEACMEWIESNLNPRYTHIRLHGSYPDLRPLMWEGFEVDPEYTYLVDLTPDEDDVLMSFSSDARSNIRDGRDAEDFVIEVGDRAAALQILEQVRNRYENQGISFHLSDDFVTQLYDELPSGSIRPYTCHVDGEFVGGILAYEHGDTIFRWQGGVRPDADVDVSINDLHDWAVMDDAMERNISTYDLVGAENRRINKYKAKFNPNLQPYYTLERGSLAMNVAAHLYKQFRSSSVLGAKGG